MVTADTCNTCTSPKRWMWASWRTNTTTDYTASEGWYCFANTYVNYGCDSSPGSAPSVYWVNNYHWVNSGLCTGCQTCTLGFTGCSPDTCANPGCPSSAFLVFASWSLQVPAVPCGVYGGSGNYPPYAPGWGFEGVHGAGSCTSGLRQYISAQAPLKKREELALASNSTRGAHSKRTCTAVCGLGPGNMNACGSLNANPGTISNQQCQFNCAHSPPQYGSNPNYAAGGQDPSLGSNCIGPDYCGSWAC